MLYIPIKQTKKVNTLDTYQYICIVHVVNVGQSHFAVKRDSL